MVVHEVSFEVGGGVMRGLVPFLRACGGVEGGGSGVSGGSRNWRAHRPPRAHAKAPPPRFTACRHTATSHSCTGAQLILSEPLPLTHQALPTSVSAHTQDVGTARSSVDSCHCTARVCSPLGCLDTRVPCEHKRCEFRRRRCQVREAGGAARKLAGATLDDGLPGHCEHQVAPASAGNFRCTCLRQVRRKGHAPPLAPFAVAT